MENWVDQQVRTQTAVSASERGCMETQLFFINWFGDVFLTNLDRVFHLYDGHSTHFYPAYSFSTKKQTDNYYPLDVAILRGLKQKWNKEICKWQRQNPSKKIREPEFIGLLSKTAEEVSLSTIINEFRVTSIYDPGPKIQGTNRNAILVSIFSPRNLAKYKKNVFTICDGTTETTDLKQPSL